MKGSCRPVPLSYFSTFYFKQRADSETYLRLSGTWCRHSALPVGHEARPGAQGTSDLIRQSHGTKALYPSWLYSSSDCYCASRGRGAKAIRWRDGIQGLLLRVICRLVRQSVRFSDFCLHDANKCRSYLFVRQNVFKFPHNAIHIMRGDSTRKW